MSKEIKGLKKLWACQKCDKEYLTRPLVCANCDGLDFYVKYGGMLQDADDLTDLITYKDDDSDKKKKARM